MDDVYYRKKDSPCKGCSDRNADCHGTCKEYLDWSKEEKQKMNEIRNVKANEHMKKEREIQKSVKRKLNYKR